MKEIIIAVQAYPYPDKLVVKVYRQLDRFHMPVAHLYSASYSQPERVRSLSLNYLWLDALVQSRVIEHNIKCWQEKMK